MHLAPSRMEAFRFFLETHTPPTVQNTRTKLENRFEPRWRFDFVMSISETMKVDRIVVPVRNS